MRTPLERFALKYKLNTRTNCWVWSGDTNDRGYGIFRYQDRRQRAHRVAWLLYRGKISLGKCVLHKCDNPPCVNPKHLYVGTHQQNMKDMALRGRARGGRLLGEHNGFSKFIAAEVHLIRDWSANGKTNKWIADYFKVTPGAISHIVTRKNWTHI